MKSLIIGPSTGWLYAIGVFSLADQEIVLKNAGANGLEIALAVLDPMDKRILSLTGKEKFKDKNLVYKSLHLPDFNSDLDLEIQINLARQLANRHAVNMVLIHPLKHEGKYPIEYFEKMISAGVPFAIENMDTEKADGFLLKELEYLMRIPQMTFVLDVQHAYEHDPAMKYARDLFEALKERLVHLHVSGETENSNHSLVHRSRNTKSIVEFIGEIFSERRIPIILEGEYKTAEDLKKEIEFLTKELLS